MMKAGLADGSPPFIEVQSHAFYSTTGILAQILRNVARHLQPIQTNFTVTGMRPPQVALRLSRSALTAVAVSDSA